jgi:chaperonin cofactor prefoldin
VTVAEKARRRVMVNPEPSELKLKYEELSVRVAKIEGQVSDATKQTIWQFVIFTVTMAGLLLGAVGYQTSVLEKRFDAKFEVLDKRLDNVEKRMDSIERNLDDLNKELRTQRK